MAQKAISISLPKDGKVSRSEVAKVNMRGLFHFSCYLASVGLNNPQVTPATSDIFARPAFIPGYRDSKIAGAEERGLMLSFAAFDVDEGLTEEAVHSLLKALPYERLIYTSRSCTPDDLHLRLIVSLARPLRNRLELLALTDHLNEQIGGGIKRIANLNHMFDCPLAAAEMSFVEGTAVDLTALMAHQPTTGVAVAVEEQPATITVAATPEQAAAAFDRTYERQANRLMEMQEGARDDTVTSTGFILGEAFAGAVMKGATLDAEEVILLFENIIVHRGGAEGWLTKDIDRLIRTVRRKFEKGQEKPFTDMGDREEVDELALYVRQKQQAHATVDPLTAYLKRKGLLTQ